MMKSLKRELDAPSSAGKRPRRSTVAAALATSDQVRVCQDLYEILRTHKTSEGRLLCQAFIRAPSKRNVPQYHEVISTPLDLLKIHQKLKDNEYQTIEQLTNDVHLMVENAKTYYARSTPEYRDACIILELYTESLQQMLGNFPSAFGDGSSEVASFNLLSGRIGNESPADSSRSLRSSSPTRSTRSKDASPSRLSISGSDPLDKSFLEELLASVVQLTDESQRSIADPFKILPSRTLYPEYYKTIKDPIDLRTIALRLMQDKYRVVNDLEKDLFLMLKNAKSFNDPGSLLYKDAMHMRKFVIQRKQEILDSAMLPISKEKARTNSDVVADLARMPSPVLDANLDLPELDDSLEEEARYIIADDPLWRLYLVVRYFADPKTQLIPAEPFCKLPSRKNYPDYYEDITSPMSLFVIKHRIRDNRYTNLSGLLQDMLQMFDNARQYNIDGSPIYENANQLQKLAEQTFDKLAKALPVDIPQRVAFSLCSDPESEASEEESEGSSSISQAIVKKIKSPAAPRVYKHFDADGRPIRGRPRLKRTQEEDMASFRKKLLSLYSVLLECKDETGRWVIGPFMKRPSSNDYPDYYKVITDPIDMETIKYKISSDAYANSKQLATDITLMCNNAKHFNEEGSQIFEDAKRLNHLFRATHNKMGHVFSPNAVIKERPPAPPRASPAISGGLSKTSSASASYRSLESLDESFAPAITSPKPLKRTASAQSNALNATGPAENTEQRKMLELYNAIKDYTDVRGRSLSVIFIKLPSKADYPDYYEVIRKPIDLSRIGTRLTNGQYESLDALVQDFNLMFDNACKYNDPESYIYKDSLTLQRVLLEKKRELKGDEEMLGGVPHVQSLVQELLATLFISVYNHQDEEGRCFSDSLAELQDLQRAADPSKKRALTLDGLKRNLDKGRYHRLDKFQEDMFEIFDLARRLSRTDSELFEDSVELQSFFIRKRDELCGNGEKFSSPALVYQPRHLNAHVELQRQTKQSSEAQEVAPDPQEPSVEPSKKKEGDKDLEEIPVDGTTYRVGDFIKVKPGEQGRLEPHIMRITRIWIDEELGETFVSGNWFYRPHETFHLATRKFLQQEVFETPFYDTVQIKRLLGKCYVMFIKDYVMFKPVDFEEKEVYVCESKYLGRVRHFKKLNQWPIDLNDEPIKFEPRKESLELVRVPSIFVGESGSSCQPAGDSADHDSDAMEEDDHDFEVLERQREEVELATETPTPEGQADQKFKYFEQLQYLGRWYKLGDDVSVNSQGQAAIYRIEKMWRSADGQSFLLGFHFAKPAEIVHEPCRMFYRNEVFATEQRTTFPFTDVTGKCAVLPIKDYCVFRPTEVFEQNVYVCERKVGSDSSSANSSTAEGARRDSICSDPGSVDQSQPMDQSGPMLESNLVKIRHLKTFKLSHRVLFDEFYYFNKPIQPQKEPSPNLFKSPGPVLPSSASSIASNIDHSISAAISCEMEVKEEGGDATLANASRKEIDIDDLLSGIDFGEYSLTDGIDFTGDLGVGGSARRKSSRNKTGLPQRSKSGYILFAAEVRKHVMAEFPDAPFGDISRMVGQEWKNLSDAERAEYDERATKEAMLFKQKKAELAELMAAANASSHSAATAAGSQGSPDFAARIQIWPCQWVGCDFQFETKMQLSEHLLNAKTGHCTERLPGGGGFPCKWQSCGKYKKNAKPFPSFLRLSKHLRVKHVEHVSTPRMVFPNQKGRNFVPLSVPSSSQQHAVSNFVQRAAGQLDHQSQQQQQIILSSPQPMQGMGHYGQQIIMQSPQQHPGITASAGGGQPPQHVVVYQPQDGAAGGIPVAIGGQQPTTVLLPSAGGGGQNLILYQMPQQQPAGQMQQYGGATVIINQQQAVQASASTAAGHPQFTAPPFAGADPGKVVIQSAAPVERPLEPVFVAPSSQQVQRVMHSETYLRYIESLNTNQTTVSKWDRVLNAKRENAALLPPERQARAADWFANPPENREDAQKMMWSLREHMLYNVLRLDLKDL